MLIGLWIFLFWELLGELLGEKLIWDIYLLEGEILLEILEIILGDRGVDIIEFFNGIWSFEDTLNLLII